MLVNAAKLLSQQAVTELHAYTGFHFSAPPYAIVAQDLPRKAGFSVVGHTISRSIGPGTSMSLFTKGLGIASTKLLSVQCSGSQQWSRNSFQEHFYQVNEIFCFGELTNNGNEDLICTISLFSSTSLGLCSAGASGPEGQSLLGVEAIADGPIVKTNIILPVGGALTVR